MASQDVNNIVVADDQLALALTIGKSATVEGTPQYMRSSVYGEAIVHSLHGTRTPMLAREGSLWVQTNVPGTPITNGIVTGFVATTPTLVLFNNNSVASGRYIYPLRCKQQVVAVGATSSDWQGQWILDTGNRWTSGGTLLTVASPNLNVPNTLSGAVIHQGALVAPAANASRIIHSAKYRSVLKVASDVLQFEFGGSTPSTPGMPIEGTLQLNQVMQLPAIALPPQCSLLWYSYGTAMGTADSFDFTQFEYVER